MAQPFDAASRQTTGGEPILVAGPIVMNIRQTGAFSVSTTGRLELHRGEARDIAVDVARPQGNLTDVGRRPGRLCRRESGSGRTARRGIVIADRMALEHPGSSISTRAGAPTRITSGPSHQFDPVWSPDGKHLIFNSNKTGWSSLFRRASDGSGGDELLVPSLRNASCSQIGRTTAASCLYSSGQDLWTLPLSAGGEPGTPSVFLQTSADEGAGVFSPDGRWIAYQVERDGPLRRCPCGHFPSRGDCRERSR